MRLMQDVMDEEQERKKAVKAVKERSQAVKPALILDLARKRATR